MGPPILDSRPPHTHFSIILPGPGFSFRPYVLQIKQKAGPLYLNTQIQTLTTKFHFLSVSENPLTDPRNPLFHLLLILLFCLLWYTFTCTGTAAYQPPKLQSFVLTVPKKKKKKIMTNFFFLHQLFFGTWWLPGDWWVFFSFLSIRHSSIFSVFFWFSQLSKPKYSLAL